jgi:hypothetical protein
MGDKVYPDSRLWPDEERTKSICTEHDIEWKEELHATTPL